MAYSINPDLTKARLAGVGHSFVRANRRARRTLFERENQGDFESAWRFRLHR